MSRISFVLPLVVCGLVACRNTVPIAVEGSSCDLSFECPAGFICKDHRCSEVVIDAGTSSGGGDGATGGGSGGGTATGGGTGGGTTDDAGSPDAGMDAGVRVAFAPGTYRRCHDDLECAVFGGNCLIDLALSRPGDGGVDRVKVSQIDSTFAADEGICTLPCTADPRICDSIVVTGPGGQSASFHCQVVYAGSSPYPSAAPAFPFDATLDTVAMSRGVPFASVCRPPFEASVTHEPSFCQACTQDMQCGSGACFIERPSATPASGSCVETCTQQSDCQFGFTCGTLPGSANTQNYCVPSAGTCGRCRDGDGDLRGVGRCGALDEPITAVDCDDANPVAYFDSANPAHAFPGVCGPSDVNCNGKSDDVEQLGSESHCGACGDSCVPRQGELANAVRQCVSRTSSMTWACVANCSPGWADCDGDVSTGCETQLTGNVVWAEDADGDGRGNPSNFVYACTGTTPPAGWVQNKLDCNDTDSTIYGGDASNAAAPELCDGKDNNCNGLADDTGFIAQENQRCTSAYPGVCSVGTMVCQARATAQAALNCVPNLDPVARASVVESCNGLDDNCDGQTDEDLDYYESQGQQNPAGHGAPVTCAVTGGIGICSQGVFACTTRTNPLVDGGTSISGVWSCAGNPAQATDFIDDLGVDSNCDGADGDLARAIFVRPPAGGGSLDGKDTNNGSIQKPVASVQKAIQLACPNDGGNCLDVFIEGKTFTSAQALTLPGRAPQTDGGIAYRIYGGFQTAIVCPGGLCTLSWTRGSQLTELDRLPPASNGSATPYGQSYAAIEGTGTVPLSLMMDRVHLVTRAPPASNFLSNGQSAPDQYGLRCGAAGCAQLELTNDVIEVEAALAGGDGTAGVAGPTGQNINGHDGTPSGNPTTYPVCGDPPCSAGGSVLYWLKASAADQGIIQSTLNWFWLGDGTQGVSPGGCGDGLQNHGGPSGGWIAYVTSEDATSYIPVGSGALYAVPVQSSGGNGFIGGQWSPFTSGNVTLTSGGGACHVENGTSYRYAPQSNPVWSPGGLGGTRTQSFSGWPALGLASNQPTFLRPTGTAGAPGWTGWGGGGGGGCLYSDAASCPCGTGRGGGGGAGGCGGFGGTPGGHGGSAVGVLLTSGGGSATLNLVTRDTLTVTVGKGGKGGKGGNGGAGAGGGLGGASPNGAPEFAGGNGGNGTGGGGGVGGSGGSSFPILRWCQTGHSTANSCGMTLPPLMLASPSDFLQSDGVGTRGLGGTGGAGGTHFPRSGVQETPMPYQKGADGQDGLDGVSSLLQEIQQ